MIAIENTLVSEDLLDRKFVCDLNACKGACCVQGDAGAPLEESEIKILEKVYPCAKSHMTPEGIEKVENEGVFVIDEDGEYVTPTVNGEQCAFVFFQEDVAKCAIEKVFDEGKTEFQKPISCHLFPVRVKKFPDYDAVNYEGRETCKPACECGKDMNVPVYRFLRGPLVRKFGKEWFCQLDVFGKLRP